MDRAHRWTDEQIEKLEKRLHREYSQAAREMKKRQKEYMRDFEAERKKRESLIDDDPKSRKAYESWLNDRALDINWMNGMVDELSRSANETNQKAAEMARDELPMVYAENANHAGYVIDREIGLDTSFALVDESTVRVLMQDDEPPFKLPKIDNAKDRIWNRQQFTNAITQGILQGKSVDRIVESTEHLFGKNEAAAVRAARTAVTGAENAGRVSSYKRAERLGIKLKQEWLATLDVRTRSSHRQLDGEKVEVGEKFSNGLRFPGDPEGAGSEVYNCFIGGTLVCTDSPIDKSYVHTYSGKLVTIDTASGVHFTCTPNHPILTANGWVPAKLLDDGDNLLITRRVDRFTLRRNPNIDHVFSSMETVHKFLGVFSKKRATGLSVNFHGDVATSNVEVVAEKGLLGFSYYASREKGFIELLLELSNSSDFGKRTPVKGIRGVVVSTSRVVRSFRILASLIRGHGSHADVHSLRTSTWLDSSVSEYAIDNLPTETVIRSELLDGLSGQVFVDKVVNVKISSTRGTQVYNLQTGNGYYFANERNNGNFIIAKNCRCTLVAAVDGIEDDEAERYSKLSKGTSYDEWKRMRG